MGRLELEFPTSSTLKSFGLRPSAFIDVGSVWKLTTPLTDDIIKFCTAAGQPTQEITRRSPTAAARSSTRTVTAIPTPRPMPIPGFRERFVGDSIKPRLSVGIRRKLGLALRTAPDRPRQGDPQGRGRRNQIVQLQRRNSILMRKILL
jgi:hypothetical protein